ncbi:MAG TPA: FliM/FliN family flagellar motor switch protein [Hyphomicrobiaceae bacterium]|nr:FliM/FliN family flagellar motor switch protein [Hyphomicrobiaceae bacterium]
MSTEQSQPAGSRRGAEKLLEAPKLSLDRVPVLHNIFERLAVTCSEKFRDICLPPASFFVNQLESGSSWDVLESYEDSIAAVYYSREWDANILIGLDRRFVFSVIEAAFGGDGSTTPFESERPFTSLEIRLAKRVFEFAIPAFQEFLQPISQATFELEKVETRVDFQILGQHDIPIVVVQILFQVMDNGGRMFVLIPQSALQPIRKRLERVRYQEPAHGDPDWARRMQDGVVRADVTLEGTLDGPELTLDELADLHVGQIIRLAADTQSLVALECEGEQLFWCKLGQAKSYFTLIVDSAVDPKQEFFSGLIFGPKGR